MRTKILPHSHTVFFICFHLFSDKFSPNFTYRFFPIHQFFFRPLILRVRNVSGLLAIEVVESDQTIF